jgi:hypothetical protein
MTEPSPSRPIPGPPRPGPRPDGVIAPVPGPTRAPAVGAADPFAGLADRPVAEHVAVFDAEHARLERELGTIDQL